MPERTLKGVSLSLALAALVSFLSGSDARASGIEPDDAKAVAQGEKLYVQHCARCHGKNMEGEKNWRVRKPDGTLPAPPHDETGYTWQQPDYKLFFITKMGGHAIASPIFKTAMPAFKDVLSDEEIWAVLSYIKHRWPQKIQNTQGRVNERTREKNR